MITIIISIRIIIINIIGESSRVFIGDQSCMVLAWFFRTSVLSTCMCLHLGKGFCIGCNAMSLQPLKTTWFSDNSNTASFCCCNPHGFQTARTPPSGHAVYAPTKARSCTALQMMQCQPLAACKCLRGYTVVALACAPYNCFSRECWPLLQKRLLPSSKSCRGKTHVLTSATSCMMLTGLHERSNNAAIPASTNIARINDWIKPN